MDRICSLQLLQFEIDKAKMLMESDKNNKEWSEDMKKLESQYEKIKNELGSGELTDKLVLENMKKELQFYNALEIALKRTGKCPDEDYGRIKKRSEILHSEIKKKEAKFKEQKNEIIIEEKKKEEEKEEKKEKEKKEEKKKNANVIYVGTNIDEDSVDPEHFLDQEEVKIDVERVNKEQYDEMIRRKEEYKGGLNYLLDNGLTKEYDNLFKKMDKFNASLTILRKKGQIPINAMPPKLTPEILLNTTMEKRKASYTELTKLLHEERLFYQNQIRSSQQENSSVMSHYTERIREISHLISTMTNDHRNPWIPCPLYHKETDRVEVNAIQRDIKEGEVVIEYFPSPNLTKNNNCFAHYELRGEGGIFKGEFSGFRYDKIKIQLPKRQKNIHEHELSFKLQEKQCFCCMPIRARIETKLLNLEEASTAVYNQPGVNSFKVVVRIRAPSNGSNTEFIERENIVIDKIYPGFREVVQSPRRLPSNEPSNNIIRRNTSIKEEKKITQPNLGKKNTMEQDRPLPEVLENLPNGVKDADIRDPDNVDNLVCVTYLEERIKVLNSRMQKLAEEGKKVPDVMKNKVLLMVRNLSLLKASIENEKLSIEQYKEYLGRQLAKDKAVLEYLVKHNQNTKAGTVRVRIEFINKELASFN